MFSLPPVEKLSSVAAALAWLLELEPATATEAVLHEAHQRGLIDSVTGSHWHADGPQIEELVRQALRRVPPQLAELGKVLHGIGELKARCHARLGGQVQAFLRIHRRDIDLSTILDAATAIDDAHRRPATLEGLASSQWITNAKMTWADYQTASYRLGHPWLDGGGVFGFSFVVKCILRVDRQAVDQWVAVNPESPALATIGAVLAGKVRRARAVRTMLKSSVTAFRLMAAVALVSPVFDPPRPVQVHEVLTILVANGIDAGDAIWIAGSLIKEAIHSRYRLESGRSEAVARRNYLDRHPEAAIGRLANADWEKQSLDRRMAELDKQHEALLPALEQMFVELSNGWPAHGLSDVQLAHLENIFVDTAEMRYRLAEKVSHVGNRNWLLNRNLACLEIYLGLTRPRAAFEESLYSTEKFATEMAPWVARSWVLLCDHNERGIGRPTGNLLNPLTSEAERLLTQPFFAARAPTLSTSVASRAACAYLFALMVVAATPEERRGEVERLQGMAIEHTRTLLSLPPFYLYEPRLFDRLASSAVHQMALFPSGTQIRQDWALSDELSDFPRALALWSSPVLVDQHPELSATLFERVGSLPLSSKTLDRQISNLLSLLDCAVASCTTACRTDLMDRIVELWAHVYADWLSISDQRADAAAEFIAAVKSEGRERTKLLDEPAFASTYCRALIVESGLALQN